MNSIQKTPEKAVALLRSRSLRELITDFLVTNYHNEPEIYTVRGWILDELERRNPDAFFAWLDQSAQDEQLFAFFHC